MKSSRHDMTYSRQDNSAVCREKSSVTSSHDLFFQELLPVFAGPPCDSVVKANLTPGTCSRQSVSPTIVRTADIRFCFSRFLPNALVVDGLDVRTRGRFIETVQRWSTGTGKRT